ncbi:MAG: S41 family peptidase [Pseudomonadota bacterium]
MAHSPRPAAPQSETDTAPNPAGAGVRRGKKRAKPVFTGGQTALLMGAALVAGAMVSGGFARPKFSADYFTNINLFGRIYEEVHQNYVTVPDDKKLIKGSIDGMLSTLDPHSSYLPADDFKTMQEQTQGSFAGLGIQVQMPNEGPDKGYVLIVAPIDDTPAARAGLQTNDLITEIDGDPVQGKTIDEAIAQMKGERGSKVELTVLRDRDAPTFKVPLVRDIVRINPVTSRAEGAFGYVRVSTFSQQAGKNVRDAVKDLDETIAGGMKGLVLDLRSNPGGLLDQAVDISDVFLSGGEIVSTRGRRPKDTLREMGKQGELLEGRPVVVLINGGSASASEIVAGALQDRNRALILGTKSFGKGSVQTVIPLQNGQQGALRLTTARYYTPSGRSIQAQGIDPDIAFPVIYPGQDAPAPRRSEADLPGALDVPNEAAESETPDEEATVVPDTAGDVVADGSIPEGDEIAGDNGLPVEPFLCEQPEGEDAEFRDCQLERALEILADNAQYKQALAQAATVER